MPTLKTKQGKGISDYHKFITIFFKSCSVHLRSKTICSRNDKAIDESRFFLNVTNNKTSLDPPYPHQCYD